MEACEQESLPAHACGTWDDWIRSSASRTITPLKPDYPYTGSGQASRVIDALLADPQWKDRIARDASGPRVGAAGNGHP